MKINETLLGLSHVLDSKKGEKGKIGKYDFQKLITEADEKLRDGDKKGALSPSEMMPNNISTPEVSVQSVDLLEKITPFHSQSIVETEKALEMLEKYQKALGDPEMDLKKIDPIVQALSEGVKGLNTLSEKLPSSDPLQKLLTEVGIVSTVEIERFNRGEYI
jgi:hypothetical protein